MVSHDDNWHARWQVPREGGPQSTNITYEEIQFWEATKWPFLEKWLPGEVSNHQKLRKTHYSTQWEPSNGVDNSSNRSMVWSQCATKTPWVFLWKGIFPLIWEEEKAINRVEIIAEKPTIRIKIYDFQASGLTYVKMALMLLGTMVRGGELREVENGNEILKEV